MTEITQSPNKISRSTVVEFVESLGLNPHHVKRLTFTPNTLFVDIVELNENGKAFRDPYNPDEMAQRTIRIPIEF